MTERKCSNPSTDTKNTKARILIQQCVRATLKHPTSIEESVGPFGIRRGMIIYISFLQGASEETVDKIVTLALKVKICEDESGKFVSVLDLPGDILIVPQATLGGKAKGKVIQYHGNIDKETGCKLYHKLVQRITDESSKSAKFLENSSVVQSGKYGERQILSMETNGPYSHYFEFS